MAQHHRLCSSYPMIGAVKMRPAMAMIELIFAIVIIAISVMTIPTMMSIANNASKGMAIDDDIMARLSGWTIDKFQARWDGNYSASGSGPLWIDQSDLNCSRIGGYRIGSDENVSSMQCNMAAWDTSIPAHGDGNLSEGIEQLNGGNNDLGEVITITSADGTSYNVIATYKVDYFPSTVVAGANDNSKTATWKLGGATFNTAPTEPTSHLKRVVTRFNDPATNTDIVLTFFKSNKGN